MGCNPILEAFGNAKTVRNDNSSRFGKYVKIQVEKKSKKIKGAEITNYLLEKSRVTQQANNERNYHIFYHLLGSTDINSLKKFRLLDDDGQPLPPQSFKYLNKSGCYYVESLEDVELYNEVKKSFDKLKFTEKEKNVVWALLASILHLGNIEFDDTMFKQTHEKNPIEIANLHIFKHIVELLGINEEALTKSLVYKSLQLKEGITISPLKKEQCIALRDSLSKGLYEKLFNWLVKRMNMSNEDHDLLTIGLLDIFGFEKFEVNSLEQLCINFTNEKLHQLYIEYVFISEKNELTEQGLKTKANNLIVPQNNNKLIELFEGPNPLCIFSIMKDSRVETISDDGLLNNLLKLKDHSHELLAPKNKFDKKFIIAHTADNVDYSIIGFKVKNNDSFPEELEKVILDSQIKEIASIYKGIIESPISDFLTIPGKKSNPTEFNTFQGNRERFSSTSNSNCPSSPRMNPNSKGKGTLLQQFDIQMRSLMTELNRCDANFIRCIKPNEDKIKEDFHSDYVLKQIKYLGVLESVKIRKESFPFRKDFKSFWNQYKILGWNKYKILGKHKKKILVDDLKLDEIKKMRHLCDWGILRNLIIDENEFRHKIMFGNSKIYMKQDLSNFIDTLQLNPDAKAIKCRLLIKQLRIWKTQKQVNAGMKILCKTCKMLRAFWNRLRTRIYRLKFLRKKKSVAIFMNLFKKKLVKKIIRVILFRKWKTASEKYLVQKKRYFTRLSLMKYGKIAKELTIFLINKKKTELLKSINENYIQRLKEIRLKALNDYRKNVFLRTNFQKSFEKLCKLAEQNSQNKYNYFMDKLLEIVNIFKQKEIEKKERDLKEKRLENEKNLKEKEALKKKQLEDERIERILKENAEKERILKEKEENERILKENAEKERILKEIAEKERILKEIAEKERILKEIAEKERILKEIAEKERILKENEENKRIINLNAENERIQKEKEEKISNEKNPKIQTVIHMGGVFRNYLIQNKFKKINNHFTKSLKLSAFLLYKEKAFKKTKFLSKKSIKEVVFSSEILTKIFGKLILTNSCKISFKSKEFYLKSIEPLQKTLLLFESHLTKGLFLFKKFNTVEEILKDKLISEDIKYVPGMNELSKSYIPINNNMIIWKNIASGWLNKGSSLNLVKIVHNDKKDGGISKEINKKFNSFLLEKNEEKQFLLAQEIIAIGFDNSIAIRDEIYYLCFIQMEKAPEKYLKLLGMITSTFPSLHYKSQILNFLNALILGTYSLDAEEDNRVKEAVRFCYRRIEKSHEFGSRSTFPNKEEFSYVWNMRKIPIRIFFSNEVELWISIESYTTVMEVISLIIKEVKADENIKKFLGLFIKYQEGCFLDDRAWIIDYAIDRKIYLKIRWFVPLDDITNPEFLNLLYIQIFIDYLNGFFRSPIDEIIDLAALAFFIEKGSQLDEEELFSINKYTPKGDWKQGNVDLREICSKILAKYIHEANYNVQNKAKIDFMRKLQKYDGFMSQDFKGDYVKIEVEGNISIEEYIKKEIILYLKPFAFILSWKNKGGFVRQVYEFKRICQFGCLKIKEQKWFYFRVWNEGNEELHLLENNKCEEIYSLMLGYAELLNYKMN